MELLELFKIKLEQTKGSTSKNTVKNYLSDVRHFILWFEKITGNVFTASKISSDMVRLYEKSLGGQFKDGNLVIGSQLSQVSTKRHISSLRKFFKILQQDGIIAEDPFTKIIPEITQEPTDYWHLKSFKDFLDEQRASKITTKNYISDIQGFARWYEEAILPTLERPLTQTEGFYLITQQILEEYRKRLIDIQNAAPRTINRKLSALRRYLSFATQKGFISASELTLDAVKLQEELKTDENEPAFQLEDIVREEPAKKTYSKIPPLRLVQKLVIFPYLSAEEASANAIATLLTGKKIDGMSKLPKLLKREVARKNALRVQTHATSGLLAVKNVAKEFYAPEKVSLLGTPIHKRVLFHARFTRPNWYKRYHNYSFVHYVHFALLVIFAAGVGVALYQNLVVKDQKLASAAPATPPRLLSFQGRLTDNVDNPITSTTNLRFAIYSDSAASGGALLWQEVNGVAPDQDGIFSILLGGGTAVPSTVFSDNTSVYLGVTVGETSELTPRQRIATVGYATNSEFLQGLPPTTQAGVTAFTNVVLALDSTGNLTLNDSDQVRNHTFAVTNGQFKFTGQSLYLSTITGSNGNVFISPDGDGRIDLHKPLVNTSLTGILSPGAVEVNDKFAILATESAVAAFKINNNTTGGDIFAASSSGTTRFVIGNDGTLTASKYTQQNGVLFGTFGSGVFDQATVASAGFCLVSGTSNPTWGTCGTPGFTSPFRDLNGSIFQLNSTEDFLAGGQSSTSATFKVTGKGNPFAGTQVAASISANTAAAALLIDNLGRGDLISASRGGENYFRVSANNGYYAGQPYDGELVVGKNGLGKLTAAILDPVIVSNQKTTGTTSLTFHTSGASNADFIFQNVSTELSRLTQAGQFQLPITGSTGGLVLGGDTQIFRGAADRIDVASGDSVNLVNGSILIGGATLVDAAGNATFNTINVTGGCTGCVPLESVSPFQQLSGAIVPNNSTLDLLIGSKASTSAKFAVLNVSGTNTPTASVSAQNVAGQALVLGGDGSIQSTRNNTLTLGGNTTGNIVIDSSSSLISLLDDTTIAGNVTVTGAGTHAFAGTLDPTNVAAFTLTGAISGGNQDISSIGNITANGSGNSITGFGTIGTNATTAFQGLSIALSGDATISGGDILGANSANLDIGEQNSGDFTFNGDIILPEDGFIGLSSSTPRFVFDSTPTPDEIDVLSGNLDLNDNLILNIGNSGTDFTSGGGLTLAGTITANGTVALGDGGDAITLNGSSLTLTGFNTCALTTNGSGVVGCNSIASTGSKWTQNDSLGILHPNNNSLDILIGGTTTASAKFAILGVATGTNPSASVSAGTTGGTFLNANGTIATTAKQTLTLGNTTTGNISLGTDATARTIAIGNSTGASAISLTTGTGAQTFTSSVTTGTDATSAFVMRPNSLTTGNGFDIASTTIAGGKLVNLKPTFSGATGGTGLYIDLADNSSNANTTNGNYNRLALTGNAAKTAVGSTSYISSTSNVGDTLYGYQASIDGFTGLAAATTRNIYGFHSNVYQSGPNSNGTVNVYGVYSNPQTFLNNSIANVYGLYSKPEIDAAGGTTNGYGLYVADGTGDTDGTTSKFAIYLEPQTGADSNFGVCFDCDGTWSSNTVASGIQFGTDIGGVSLFRSASNTLKTDGQLFVNSGNNGGIASLVVNQTGVSTNDILAASSSGVTRFVIKNDGNASSSAGFTINGLGNIQSTNNQTLTIGGGTTGNITLAPNGGTGNIRFSNFGTNGGLLYTNASGVLVQAGAGTATQCLLGGTTPTFGSCATGTTNSPFYENLGSIIANNSTLDFLLGGQSSASAKFAVLNLNGGGPATATISGNLIIMPTNGAGGVVGIGTNSPAHKLDVVGDISTAQVSIRVKNTSSASGYNAAGFIAENSTSFGQLFKAGVSYTGYKTIQSSDLGFFNTTAGNISILNDFASGNINFAAGGASSAQLMISSTGLVGLGTASPISELYVTRLQSSGATGKALAIFDQTENQDILAASASGSFRLKLSNDGSLVLRGGQSSDLDTLTATTLKIGATTATTLTIGRTGQSIVYPGFDCSAFGSGGKLTTTAGGVLTCSADSTGSGFASPFRELLGSIVPLNSTEDFLIGGQSSASASFKVSPNGTSPTASVSGRTSYAALVVDNRGLGDLFAASSSGLNRFVIKQDGKVGIGTSIPTDLLAMAGGNFMHTASGNPTLKGGLATPGISLGVFISGNYAYTANDTFGLMIVDMSYPSNPTMVGSYDTSGNSNDVFVAGKYAYIADGTSGLQIIDISNPLAPQLVGTVDTPGSAIDVYVSGKYAYVSDDGTYIIVDVSNPSNPIIVGSFDPPGNVLNSFIQGKYAYVALQGSGLAIVDISNPASPYQVGTAAASNFVVDVYVSGRYAYVGDWAAGLKIWDVKDPRTPVLVGTYDSPSNVGSIYVSGKYAYIADNTAGVKVVDITNPAIPTLVGGYDFGGTAQDVHPSGKYLYVAGDTTGLKVIDINGTETPAISTGFIETASINITENAVIGNNLSIGTGLNIGDGGIFSSGTLSIITASGAANLIQGAPTGSPLFTLNYTGIGQDIFNASSSGILKFAIKSDGTASSAAGFTIDAAGSIQTTRNQTLTIGGNTTGNIFLSPLNDRGSVVIGSSLANNPGALALAKLSVFGSSGTQPVASFSGNTIRAILSLNNSGTGDFISASKSGNQLFRVDINGNVFLGGCDSSVPGDPAPPDCTGKVYASQIDPLYTIDGKKYSTYAPSMIGLKEELADTVNISYNSSVGAYAYILNLSSAPKDSDLWVFSRITNPDISKHTILLSSNSNARTWYKKDAVNRTITIFSDRPSEVSFRITAMRFDHLKGPTINTDDTGNYKGIIAPTVDHLTSNMPNSNPADPSTDTYIESLVLVPNNQQYKILDPFGNAVNHVDAFSKAVIANVSAGIINAQKTITGTLIASVSNIGNATASSLAITSNNVTIGGRNLQAIITQTVEDIISGGQFIASGQKITSPLAEIDKVRTNVLSPLADSASDISLQFKNSRIEIHNANSMASWFDRNGNASFSGELTADSLAVNNATISGTLAAGNIETSDASISGTLRAGNIIANNIEGLDNKIASITSQLLANNSNGNATNQSTSSGQSGNNNFAYDTVHANFGIFEQGITSMGPVTSNILTATDSLSVGQSFSITNNAINSVGNDLELQSLRQGAIAFQGGLIRMDTDGNMTVNGNLSLLGKVQATSGIFTDSIYTKALATNIISPLAGDDLTIRLTDSASTPSGKLKIKDSSNKEVLSINSRGDIIASGTAQFAKLNFNLVGEAQASSLTEAVASGSAGFATLRSGQPEITIKNPNVTSKSLIYITPFGDTGGRVFYLLRQVPQSDEASGSFTVGASGPTGSNNLQFNWLIVN